MTKDETRIRDEGVRIMHDYWSELLARLHHQALQPPGLRDGKAVIDEAMLSVAVASIAIERGPAVAVDQLEKLIASLGQLIPEKKQARH